MITLQNISKKFGSRTLFEHVNVTFLEGKRYGLTGPNGAGKTTLMRMIMGLEDPSTGLVILPQKVGILQQNIEPFQHDQVLDVIVMGNQRLHKALERRDHLYTLEMTDEVGLELGDLEGIIAEENGYQVDSDAEILLEGIGIDPSVLYETMGELPTDIQFKILVCQALFGQPQALLLDEPTNHLDMDSIAWLEEFLFNFSGCLVVTSHDRHFLNSVTTDIADIDYETIIVYPGNYDDMVETKTKMQERQDLEAKSKEKKIAKLQEFLQKFGAGSRASQARSRAKEIDRLKPQENKKTNIQRPYIRFIPSEKQPGKILIQAHEIAKAYQTPVFSNLSLEIERGDKIGVIGANGRGKTTLLKLLSQSLMPDHGSVEMGHQTLLSYFPQNHQDILNKQTDLNAYEYLRATRQGIYDQDIRSVLGKLLFSGDDAFKPVKTLSGGETARLILASMMLQEHNLLVLDEPNNHLDLEAVSALAWGLDEYKGTVIVASHDRSLISNVANKLIAFEKDAIHIYHGTLDEYLASPLHVTKH